MKPNIVYIHSHDTGRYIQPYGYAVPTPNLQRFAEGGMVFRKCFCGAPTCSASRAALLTGQCSHSAGQNGLVNRGFVMGDVAPSDGPLTVQGPSEGAGGYGHHMVQTLKPAGYYTALSGTQHIVRPRDVAMIGYDEVLQIDNHPSPNEAAIEFLKRPHDRPFFLSVGFGQTHRAFPEPEVDERYVRPPEPLPDTDQTRYDWAAFCTAAADLDRRMGSVFDTLDERGLADSTLVVCTTDHGVAFPRMKCNLYDSGIGVMLMMRGPGGFTGGKVTDAIVSHVDVFPTICDVAGIETPEWLEGVSLVPLADDPAAAVREEVFSEVTYHGVYEPMRCIRTNEFKYIRRFGDRKTVPLPNCDDSPSKTLWMEHGWANIPIDDEQLYNIIFDPNEQNNLVDCPAMKPVMDDLRARLEQWMRGTSDPLLDGPVPAPKGAQVNDPDDPSPRCELKTIK